MKVVILGAGASKECGLPLSGNIWDYFNLNKPSNHCWHDFLRDTFNFYRITDKYPTIEIVLALLENHIRSGQGLGRYCLSDLGVVNRKLKAGYAECIKDLCLAQEHPERDFENHRPFPTEFDAWYKHFFKTLMKEAGDNTAFISINYDTLLDLALKDLIKEEEILDYGVEIYDLEKQNKKCDRKRPLLLKPNGSVNLVWCRKCGKVFTKPYSAQGGTNDTYECNNCKKNLEALIKFPPYNDEIAPLTAIRRKIIEVISEADEILAIGYSLPDYDIHILDALLGGAMANKKRQALRLEIVDKIDDKEKRECLLEKYRHIFCEPKSSPQWGGFKKYAEDFCKINAELN